MSKKEYAELMNDAYAFWLDGHSISETADCFDVQYCKMYYYIAKEKKRSNEAAAHGNVIKHTPTQWNPNPPDRWMSDEEIKNSWKFAANKTKQIKILAQLNGMSPMVVKRIVEGGL